MAKISIVVNIDEEIYKEAIKSGYSHLYDEEVANAIADGKPLVEVIHRRCKQCGNLNSC